MPLDLAAACRSTSRRPTDEVSHLTEETPATAPTPALAPKELKWTSRFGTAINALVLGAVISGAVLGLILDFLWQFAATRVTHRRALHAQRKAVPRKPPGPDDTDKSNQRPARRAD